MACREAVFLHRNTPAPISLPKFKTNAGHTSKCRSGRKEQLELAVAKVKAKQLSMRKAAETYGVPVSTLHSHVHSIPEKVGAGRPTVLTHQEEKEISIHMPGNSIMVNGYSLTR